jgi:hypothetical protein
MHADHSALLIHIEVDQAPIMILASRLSIARTQLLRQRPIAAWIR